MDDFYSVGHLFDLQLPLSARSGYGAWVVTSRYEIIHDVGVVIDDIGNGKAWVENKQLYGAVCRTGFYDRYIKNRKCSYTRMLGAVCGDIAGSVYEHHNIKYIPDKDKLISHRAHFTDDSVLTLGVAVGIMNGLKKLNKYSDFTEDDEPVLSEEIKNSVYLYGNKYPYAGYGRTFRSWLSSADRAPYNSWANGSAMRVSYAGHAAHSLKDAEFLASVSAKVTHNHPEGIKGAVAIAAGIYILRDTPDKAEGKKRVYDYISKLYDIDFKLDDIRDSYTFDVSCAGSVPYAVKAFLEGESFEEVIALAISIGGDSDTIAAMAGSLAEVIYPIPEGYRDRVLKRLDYDFKSNLAGVIDFMVDTQSK